MPLFKKASLILEKGFILAWREKNNDVCCRRLPGLISTFHQRWRATGLFLLRWSLLTVGFYSVFSWNLLCSWVCWLETSRRKCSLYVTFIKFCFKVTWQHMRTFKSTYGGIVVLQDASVKIIPLQIFHTFRFFSQLQPRCSWWRFHQCASGCVVWGGTIMLLMSSRTPCEADPAISLCLCELWIGRKTFE